MPAISRIRLCNVLYENGGKRYNDEIFHLDGQNTVILLENGGGKTVFIQTVLQAVIPHTNMADRKIKDSLFLDHGPAHIAVEWILQDQPRRYGVTCVSLFLEKGQLQSLKYTYEYSGMDKEGIESIPFKVNTIDAMRPATRGEIADYYQRMEKNHTFANTFKTISDYGAHLESVFKIVPSEWRKIAVINSGEGNVDEYFNRCKTTEQLLNTLLIPVIEEALNTQENQSFAETFEKQREHFKKNQILQEKIDQTQQVKEHMDHYVRSYKSYDKAMEDMNKVRGGAHGAYIELSQRLQSLESEKDELFQERIQIQEDEKDYRRQQVSYQYTSAIEQVEVLKGQYDALNGQLETIESNRKAWASRRQNIQWTLLLRNMKLTEDRIQRLEEALNTENENLSIQDVRVRLDENSHHIHGSYSYELELMNQEMDSLKQELMAMEQEGVALLATIETVQEEEKREQEVLYKARALAEHNQTQMDAIYDALSDTWVGLDVAQYEKEQQEAYEEAKKSGKEQQKLVDELSKGLEETKLELEVHNKEVKHGVETLDKMKSQMARIHEESKRVDDSFARLGYKGQSDVLVYPRQNLMEAFLEEENARIAKRETLLASQLNQARIETYVKERIHPDIKELYTGLLMEFPATITGDMYLDELSKRKEYTQYNLWDMIPFSGRTFIVEKQDQDGIAAWFESYTYSLLDPIYLMTRGDVVEWIEEGKQDENLRLHFVETRGVRVGKCEDSKAESISASIKEEQVAIASKHLEIHDARRQLALFLDRYPYGMYQQLTHDIFDQEQHYGKMLQELEGLEEKHDRLRKQVEEKTVFIAEIEDACAGYEHILTQTADYMRLEEDYRGYREEEENAFIKLSDCRFSLAQHQKALNEYYETKRYKQSQISGLSAEVKRIHQDALYQEVKGYTPICTNEERDVLIDRRQQLIQELNGLSITAEQIRSQLGEQRRLEEHYEQQQRRLEKEAEHPLETVETFYEQEEDELYDRMVEAKKQMKEIHESLGVKQKELWAKEAEAEIAQKELDTQQWVMEEFQGDMVHVPKSLRALELSIKDRGDHNRKREKSIERQLHVIRDLMTELRVLDGKYAFMSVKPIVVNSSIKQRLESEPENVYEQLVTGLKVGLEEVQEKKAVITSLREAIVDFCKTTIQDHRLKDAMINGLILKDNYEDLLLYQERLSEIIHKTITLAEDDRRESDKELSTFLNHLVTYVELVMHEFGELQDKTRIDVDGEWINIFTFDVPVYTKEEAYDYLRDYLDQMIMLVDEKIHRNEEDIRSHIEDALSIKNLIPVILGHRPIKVKCRKVTNDMKVSQMPTSWEYSNRWSGGEKWSKNMTLFLGILNYLAEKKQYLSSNQKKNRTVILDNPFGKASSKHVLDPVFYIAERLGFQMIALTAHAEGQFITDYFPVVYSLRLRESNVADKMIVNASRSLNMVYLKEKAPASIERLQEAEQLKLFDTLSL